MSNYSQRLYVRIVTQLPITPHSPLSVSPNLHQAIPNPTTFRTILPTLHKHVASHSRIPNTNTHTHPHTHPVQTYAQWCTHSDISTVTTRLLPSPYQRRPTNIDTWDNITENQKIYEDEGITQQLWDTPTRSALCGLFKNFSYTLLIKTDLDSVIYFSIICAAILHFLYDTSRPIMLCHSCQYWPKKSYPPHIGSLSQSSFFPLTCQRYVCQSCHTRTKIFFSIWYSNAVITFETSFYLPQYHN